jgi:two-component system, response regulator
MTTGQDIELLLVDDNPSDIELTIYSLRQNKLASVIYVAEDGKDALDFIFCRAAHGGRSITDRPKVILLDLKLPKLDGLEVLKAIRADERTKAIPVVILTSSKEHKDIVEGYKLGVSAFVQKPVDFEQFRRTIKDIGVFWLVVNETPPPEAFGIWPQMETSGASG